MANLKIKEEDLLVEANHRTNPGGQHACPSAGCSAVKVTHVPSGIAVECFSERSQFKNRDKAKEYLFKLLEQTEPSNV